MGDTTVGDISGSQRGLVEQVSSLVELAKELQDLSASLISRTSREEDSLRQRLNSLNSTIQSLRSSIRKSNLLDSKRAEKLEEELFRAKYILTEGDAAAFLPSKSHGRFLRMFLGPINVRANRKDVQLKVKEEYNSFRDRTAYLFILFPLLLIVLRSWIWNGCLPALPVQLYQKIVHKLRPKEAKKALQGRLILEHQTLLLQMVVHLKANVRGVIEGNHIHLNHTWLDKVKIMEQMVLINHEAN